MPITLGCPSCAKRFRARDESAGKKVKCPYCQAAVQVPTAEESATAGAPTAPIPTGSGAGAIPPAPSRAEPAPGSAPVIASPADWGASPAASVPPAPLPPPPKAPEPELPPMPAPGRGAKKEQKERPRPLPPKGQKPPEQILAGGWLSVRRGLFWVQLGLVWVALMGFVDFGKAVYVRSQGPLPKGDGADWIKIEGFVNDKDPMAIPLRKEEIIDLAAYGVPAFFASVLFAFGRLVASGAPRMSGSRALYALSSFATVLAFLGLAISIMFSQAYKEESGYGLIGFLILAPLAEYWFLTALTASGLALRRPGVARTVGFLGFLIALWAAVIMVGVNLYETQWRPKPVDADIRMYEKAAVMLGWLLVVGVYWRAVRGVRVAAREYIDTVEERA